MKRAIAGLKNTTFQMETTVTRLASTRIHLPLLKVAMRTSMVNLIARKPQILRTRISPTAHSPKTLLLCSIDL
jgi:hypothetical protein